MVQYTLAQSPETIFTVSGKDSLKAREKAMDQLIELMDTGKLPTELADGFSPQQFIEVKEPTSLNPSDDDAITQAVQILSNLANLKLKLQESRSEALQVRTQIDVLFSDEPVSEEEITSLKEGFKVLKTYAQANLRYREARSQAEQAREILDQALSAFEPEAKAKPESTLVTAVEMAVEAESEVENLTESADNQPSPATKPKSEAKTGPKAGKQ
jgi:soluble cytochrome b562